MRWGPVSDPGVVGLDCPRRGRERNMNIMTSKRRRPTPAQIIRKLAEGNLGGLIRSGALIRSNAGEADHLCPAFSTIPSPCSPASQPALADPRTWRSSCYVTNSQSYAARSTDPHSTATTAPCSERLPQRNRLDRHTRHPAPMPTASPVTEHMPPEHQDAHRPRSGSADSPPSIVWQILKANGIDPSSERSEVTWSQFLHS